MGRIGVLHLVVSEQVGLSGQVVECCLSLSTRQVCVTLSVLVCFSNRLYAGVGLKISGGEALLLGYVSVARCWFGMLLMATVQVLLKFVVSRIRRRHGFKILFVDQVGAS